MRRFLVLLFLLPTLTYAQGAGTPPYRGVNNWNLIFGTDNVFDIGANAAQRPRTGYFGTSVITPALTVSGLTQTRVPFAGSGGLISDDADLTFDGTSLIGAKLRTGAGTAASPDMARAADTDDGLYLGELSCFVRDGVETACFSRSGTVGTIRVCDASSAGCGTNTVIEANQVNGLRYLTNATTVRGFVGGSANVASATALPVPVGRAYHVTGTTTITSITSTNIGSGTVITLIFDGALTFTDGSNLKLNGDFVTSADDTITLMYDGTNWYEMARSAN